MSGEWTAERWCGWLRRKRTDALPSWQGLNDAANGIGEEVARLRVVEASHALLQERITALQHMVSSCDNSPSSFEAAWKILVEARHERP